MTTTNDIDAIRPATDLLIANLRETVGQVQAHEHPERGGDLYCLNLTSYMGDRMGPVLRRLADEQAEAKSWRDRHTALADEFTAESERLHAEVAERDAELEKVHAELAETQEHLAIDRQAVTTLREREQQARAELADVRNQAHRDQQEHQQVLRDKNALANENAELKRKLDLPCGSCHPCTNYADETWRAAGQKPPHVITWNDTQDELKALRPVAAAANEWRRRYGNTSEAFDTACKALVAVVDALPNPEQHFELCPGYGCPGCRDAEAVAR